MEKVKHNQQKKVIEYFPTFLNTNTRTNKVTNKIFRSNLKENQGFLDFKKPKSGIKKKSRKKKHCLWKN